MSAPKDPSVEAVKALFGDHPEDVISPIKSAAETLAQLQEIFATIKKEALIENNGHRLKLLAEAGAYLSVDMCNYAGTQHDEYLSRLIDAGIVSSNVKGVFC